jgi:hypothetical protein
VTQCLVGSWIHIVKPEKNQNSKIDPNQWLKPVETSIKVDKLQEHENHKMTKM